jgi:hypothetical protein
MAAEEKPRTDPTTEAINQVTATLGGETTGTSDPLLPELSSASAEIVLPPLRGVLETPQRPCFSTSDSASRYSHDRSKNYSHKIWAPDKRPDGSDEPGHLTVTAYLDREGYLDPYGNAYDRYHYRTAADLALLANMGMRDVMAQLGIVVAESGSNLYYNRYYTVKVDFPSAQVFRERANKLLADHAAATGRQPVQLAGAGIGRYSADFYMQCLREGKYPIADEYGTLDHEVDRIDEGTHDVLAHGLAMILASGTSLIPHIQEDTRKNMEWAAAPTAARPDAILGHFMHRYDIGFSARTFIGALRGQAKELKDFHSIAGPQADLILEQIRKNATTPHETGLLRPSSSD